MSALDLRGVSKSYGGALAFDSVYLVVPSGTRAAIVGPSGSGKTTLLRLIAGFELPDAGSILLDGATLVDPASAVPAFQRSIGYVPQEGALFPHLTVSGNIGFGLPARMPGREAAISRLMDLAGLERGMAGRLPHELSGGQQQRVALARALAQQPKLMLLDEPFSALDTALRANTRRAVARVLADADVTTVLVTHDHEEALSFADQLAVMRGGRLVQAGRPTDLYLRPRDEAVASFLGESLVLDGRVAHGAADCALGRIAVDDDRVSGAAKLLLRPQQLELTMVDPQAPPDGCIAMVTERDFNGESFLLSLRIVGRDAGSAGDAKPDLMLRSPSIDAPAVGDTVSVRVRGRAHLLG
jgi:iron(III) transport system ATP-binding protein